MSSPSDIAPYVGDGEPEKSINFLKRMHPNELWLLACISADNRSIETRAFSPQEAEECLQWIRRWILVRNLYWHVNPPRARMSRKAGKEDIKCISHLHVDVNPVTGKPVLEEQCRILALLSDPPAPIPKPSVMVFSGGGYQAFWKLEVPIELDGTIETAERGETYNKRLEQSLGGDHCHNCDRLMRLPGSINFPNKKKVAKGRVRALAYVVDNF